MTLLILSFLHGMLLPVLPAVSARAEEHQRPTAGQSGENGRIVLVRGTVSLSDENERHYARSLTRRLTRWLNDMNVPHSVIDDEAVAANGLMRASVVILGYNPYPTKKELSAFRNFVRRGGKLIVFYSADAELAGLLDMKLGKYMSSGTENRWSAFSFNESAPDDLPKTILQESRNIRPVFPKRGRSKVIAHWRNAGGKILADPAWVQSDRGLWMSHVLLGDGDTENKKRMLVGLIAMYDASVWRTAAARYMETYSKVGRYRDFQDAVRAMIRVANHANREQRVRKLLSRAGKLHDEVRHLFEEQKYPDVIEKSVRLKDLLVEAYGCTQKSRANEFRGVWDHTGTGLYPGDWKRTCKILSDHGITDIMPNMLWGGIAHYDSAILPGSAVLRRYGDQLKQCVTAAHRNGIGVHVWKVCWRLDGAPASFVAKIKKQRRLQVSDTGHTLNWLCPSHPDNLKLELDSLKEVARRYKVEGVHLDYIRYPDSHACYCEGCRNRFGKELGETLNEWPAAVRNGALANQYNQWRCAQITRLVRQVSEALRDINPCLKISAAVFGTYPSCVDSIAQDWTAWLENGYVDFVCPMNYTSDLDKFTNLVRRQVSVPFSTGRIFPGLGVTTSESTLDAVRVVDQIAALRQQGVSGFVLFDLNRNLETEILPVLRLGITARTGSRKSKVQDDETVEKLR